MTRPRILDVFSGAGGAAMGYFRAGFDVVGVDIEAQRNYPFEFHQCDALQWLRRLDPTDFDAIHASPPCQDHSKLRTATKKVHGTGWLVAATRELLEQIGLPWVIENVPGAPVRTDYRLCGCQFDNLPGLRRERWFETSWHGFVMQPPCSCPTGLDIVDVTGHNPQGRIYKARRELGLGPPGGIEEKRAAMGIDWMNRNELAQAIPPAYTERIGADLLAVIREREAS